MKKYFIKNNLLPLETAEKLPDQILSGAIHYFRVHPALWRDRLQKAVAMGLNTVETYVPWNLHEPHEGEFVFDGICDVKRFISEAAALGLWVIVRPGPFICAEWDNGGFPGWLLAKPGVKLRRTNQVYLDAVDKYFVKLFSLLKDFQITSGGPVFAMQVENEYGSYGNDKAYLQHLIDLYRANGIDVPLFTSDGPYGSWFRGGMIDGALATGNFGTHHEQAFANMHEMRPGEPECCMEFWNGWYDRWGQPHHRHEKLDGEYSFTSEFEAMVKRGATINHYMFHGGTNFGFTAGASGNFRTNYAPVTTSYDYDCTLSECGDPTEKFKIAQDILKKYTNNPRIAPVQPTVKTVPLPGKVTAQCVLRENLDAIAAKKGKAVSPPTLEELGENFGFIYYRTNICPLTEKIELRLFDVNDYAQVWQDGNYLGHRMRDTFGNDPIDLALNDAPGTIDVLVENLGRINYGPFIGTEQKGIAGGVCLGFQRQFNWEYFLLPMSDVSNIPFGELKNTATPASFYRGTFTVDKVGEAFLKRPGAKGCVWVNGFALGRYWEIGPTNTLYVPSPILKEGENEIIIFEQEALYSDTFEFSPVHDPGPTAPPENK